MYPLHVTQLAPHPSLDIAIGLARVPMEASLKVMSMADAELPLGATVLVFGYAHSTFEEHASDCRLLGGSGLLGLTSNIICAFHLGAVDGYYPDGFSLLKGQPSFVHTAETLGAQSGGPILDEAQRLVYGVTSTGSEQYGVAVDIRAIFDWRIPFLERYSLRDLANLGFVRVRVP